MECKYHIKMIILNTYLFLFYINYMECKSKQLVALLKTTARFILTIWNINSNSDIFILIV